MYLPLDKLGLIKRALIFFTLPEWYYFIKIFSPLYKIKWLNINFAIVHKESLLIGPVLSSPQLALTLDLLISKGLKSVFALGWAGKTPYSQLELGTLFLPTKAISLEGTSFFYFKKKKIFTINKEVLLKIKENFSKFSILYREGNILSVDAPLVVEKKMREFSFYLKKVEAMDMETSALFAIGEYHKLEVGVVQFITDEIGKKDYLRPEDKLVKLREKIFPFLKNYLQNGL